MQATQPDERKFGTERKLPNIPLLLYEQLEFHVPVQQKNAISISKF